MELHGTTVENVVHAVASARRLRGHPVYKETLAYWADLLQEARRSRRTLPSEQLAALDTAILQLETELADRGR